MKTVIVTSSVVALVACLAVISGCSDPHYGLKRWQVEDLRTWEEGGQPIIVEKKPETATTLGFFIGLGSFYTNEPALGAVDLLFWPISILWEPWIAPGLANEINYEATKHAWERKRNLST